MDTHLTDKEWQFLAQLVRQTKTARGRPPTKHRQIFEAIFWIASSARPWRSLPKELGKWNTVYRQFARWSKVGLWQKILDELEKNPKKSSADGVSMSLAHRARAAQKLAERTMLGSRS